MMNDKIISFRPKTLNDEAKKALEKASNKNLFIKEAIEYFVKEGSLEKKIDSLLKELENLKNQTKTKEYIDSLTEKKEDSKNSQYDRFDNIKLR